MKKHTLAFIDLETTGLDPTIHEIIEIGCILAKQTPRKGKGPLVEKIEEFDIKVKPEHIETATAEALRINKYSEAEWMFASSLEQAIKQLAPKISGAILVGQNTPFDLSFLEAAFKKVGIPLEINIFKLDIVSLAFAKFYDDESMQKFGNYSLCERLGIKNEQAHTALSDIRASFEVYKKLLSA
jgi:DNA polymerase-3 subunit alpha (Gram-positive type)